MHTALALSLAAAMVVFVHPAFADDNEPPLHESGAPEQFVRGTVQINPIAAFIGEYGGAVEVVPAPHHALIATAYYANTSSTDPTPTGYSQFGDALYDTTHLWGAGGEIGYRRYLGALGPHGLFYGPSLVFGFFDAHSPRTGVDYRFWKYGVAFDVGYQAIVGPVAFSIGAGVQYTRPSEDIPDQSLYVAVHTGDAVRPRILGSIGYAF